MRLFIAICLPENTVRKLDELTDQLEKQGIRGNRTRPENLHITLAFLGEVEEKDVPSVKKAMERVSFPKMRLYLADTGMFRDILCIGLKDTGRLEEYAGNLRKSLADDGIWFDPKPFKPHITLMRRVRGRISADNITIPFEAFTAAHVSLMKSERINGRLIYTEI